MYDLYTAVLDSGSRLRSTSCIHAVVRAVLPCPHEKITIFRGALYRSRDTAKGDIILHGVREIDWFLSADKKWVLPHDQMGLSFSSSFRNLKNIYRGKKKHNPGKQVNVYWVLEQADLPPGMAFVQDRDRKKEGHYFLTVTERMTLFKLVQKLKAVARRMSVMTDAGKVL